MLIAGTANLGPDQTATTKSTARGNGQVQSNTSAHMHIAVVWLGLAWLALVCFVLFGWSHLWRCTVAGAGGVCAAVRWARPVNEELKRVANQSIKQKQASRQASLSSSSAGVTIIILLFRSDP